MTEDEVRALLCACDDMGGWELWIAAHPWQAMPDGWIVPCDIQGWCFQLVPTSTGLRITASDRSGVKQAVWIVPIGR